MGDLRGELQAYATRLYGYAFALTRDAADAEDLVQDTFLRAMDAARAPREAAALRAWLFRILRNRFIDLQRSRRRDETPLDEISEADELAPADRPLGEPPVITALTVRFGLMKLTPRQREILALVDVAGFSYAETAQILDIPPGTVMSRLARARAALLDAVGESNIIPLAHRGRRA